MTHISLTPSQAKVLAVIKRWLATEGIAPTVREIMAEIGVASVGHVCDQLRGLGERGYIRRLYYKSRAIELLEPARNWTARPVPAPRYRFIPVSSLTWPVTA
jgi:SOS-response transcriptional repressor LexA